MGGGDNPLPLPQGRKKEEKEIIDGGVKGIGAIVGVNQCVIVLRFKMRPKVILLEYCYLADGEEKQVTIDV